MLYTNNLRLIKTHSATNITALYKSLKFKFSTYIYIDIVIFCKMW